MVYVASNPNPEINPHHHVEFLYNEQEIFFYFLDENEMDYVMENGSGKDWELIDFKYLTEKLSMHFELYSKN